MNVREPAAFILTKLAEMRLWGVYHRQGWVTKEECVRGRLRVYERGVGAQLSLQLTTTTTN